MTRPSGVFRNSVSSMWRGVASCAVGTLKPTHAITMHAIQLLPVLAWLLSFTSWTERRRLSVVLLVAAGYVALAAMIILTNLQAV